MATNLSTITNGKFSQNSDEGSLTELPFFEHNRKVATTKRTCRFVFRSVITLCNLTILIVTVVVLFQQAGFIKRTESNQVCETLQNDMHGVVTMSKGVITTLNNLIEITSVNLPFQMKQFGQGIVTQVTQMVRQCNAVCKGPTIGPDIQNIVYPASYESMIKHPVNNSNILLSEIRQPLNFVPNTGKLNGCTRTPSFSVYNGFWCYTHAESDWNCNGSSPYMQVFRVGVVTSDYDYNVIHKTLHTKTSRLANVTYQCSTISTGYECYFLCSTPNVDEITDYKTPGIESLQIYKIDNRGTFAKFPITDQLNKELLTALYPGPGNGVLYQGRLLFPMHGGMQSSELNKVNLNNTVLSQFNDNKGCNATEIKLESEFPGTFTSPYYSNQVMLNYILICEMIENLPGNCDLQIVAPKNMSMGSESQLYSINNKLYLYQRSSSRWPYPLIYEVGTRLTNRQFRLRAINRFLIKSTTRPGSEGCNIYRVCPKVCVTGVYQAPWILHVSKAGSQSIAKVLYAVAWSKDHMSRKGPLFSICDNDTCFLTKSLASEHVHSGYSITRCYLENSERHIICVVIMELDASPWAEMRIQSVIYNITLPS
ncbi:attachment protein [Achimota virus 1]|uniref:Attachment protein n=1 Tax=Achimota virus 1 TaxID=1261100 RepID=K7Y0L4_9MONO|nr:attachment protein [Achimota virus 1]AFX75109.1 attachment protein [Achimota virus 1]